MILDVFIREVFGDGVPYVIAEVSPPLLLLPYFVSGDCILGLFVRKLCPAATIFELLIE